MKPACRFFNSPKGCRLGEECSFQHVTVMKSKTMKAAPPCRFFASSRGCKLGKACKFRHEKVEEPVRKGKALEKKKVSPTPTKPTPKAKGLTKPSKAAVMIPAKYGPMYIGPKTWEAKSKKSLTKMPPTVFALKAGALDWLHIKRADVARHLVKVDLSISGWSDSFSGSGEWEDGGSVFYALRALQGHPNLRILDISGVDFCDDILEEAEKSREEKFQALREVVLKTPHLAVLKAQRCFADMFSLIYFVDFVLGAKGCHLIKVDVSGSLGDHVFEDEEEENDLFKRVSDLQDFEKPLRNVLKRHENAVKALRVAISNALQRNPQMVELDLLPVGDPEEGPLSFKLKNVFDAIAKEHENHLCYNVAADGRRQFKDDAPFLRLPQAWLWTPQRHHLFPYAFKRGVFTFLLITRRAGLLRDLAHLIVRLAAQDHPISSMALDLKNIHKPLERHKGSSNVK
jgi:hypothetical protein